jgi:hypothetical protein
MKEEYEKPELVEYEDLAEITTQPSKLEMT